jgi:hypothetical protein
MCVHFICSSGINNENGCNNIFFFLVSLKIISQTPENVEEFATFLSNYNEIQENQQDIR